MSIRLYCTYSATSSSSRSNRTRGASWALQTRKDKDEWSKQMTAPGKFCQLEFGNWVIKIICPVVNQYLKSNCLYLQTLHGFQVCQQLQWVQRLQGHQQVPWNQKVRAHHGLPEEWWERADAGQTTACVCVFCMQTCLRCMKGHYLESSRTGTTRGSIVTRVTLKMAKNISVSIKVSVISW